MRRDSSIDELTDLHALRARVASSEAQSRDHLLALQEPDGHWCGELAGDTILESEFIMLMCFLGRLSDPLCRKAAAQIRRQQIPESGWAIYPGGPPEVSASVKCYFVLALLGD